MNDSFQKNVKLCFKYAIVKLEILTFRHREGHLRDEHTWPVSLFSPVPISARKLSHKSDGTAESRVNSSEVEKDSRDSSERGANELME